MDYFNSRFEGKQKGNEASEEEDDIVVEESSEHCSTSSEREQIFIMISNVRNG